MIVKSAKMLLNKDNLCESNCGNFASHRMKIIMRFTT